MLGAVRYTVPDDLRRDLDWIEAHVDGRSYGLDVVMPAKKVEGVTEADVEAMIPEGHRQFVKDTLAEYGVPELAEGEASGWRVTGWMEQVARTQLDVAFDYPIKLLANALGSPPADVIERAHDRGVLVAALAGSARQAEKHKAAGIDIVVAQGYEAGGHTGEIASMVLTPGSRGSRRPVARAGGRRHRKRPTGGCRTHPRRPGRVAGLHMADHHRGRPAFTRADPPTARRRLRRHRAFTRPDRQARTAAPHGVDRHLGRHGRAGHPAHAPPGPARRGRRLAHPEVRGGAAPR